MRIAECGITIRTVKNEKDIPKPAIISAVFDVELRRNELRPKGARRRPNSAFQHDC
jgi:hypothetical protein